MPIEHPLRPLATTTAPAGPETAPLAPCGRPCPCAQPGDLAPTCPSAAANAPVGG